MEKLWKTCEKGTNFAIYRGSYVSLGRSLVTEKNEPLALYGVYCIPMAKQKEVAEHLDMFLRDIKLLMNVKHQNYLISQLNHYQVTSFHPLKHLRFINLKWDGIQHRINGMIHLQMEIQKPMEKKLF